MTPRARSIKPLSRAEAKAGGGNQVVLFSSSSELPLNFLTSLNNVQVYEKDEARFEVELSRPPKSFRWLKGSQELQSDDRYELLQDGNSYVLLIRSAAYEDEAKYMFEAEDKRTSCKLILQGPLQKPNQRYLGLVSFSWLVCSRWWALSVSPLGSSSLVRQGSVWSSSAPSRT